MNQPGTPAAVAPQLVPPPPAARRRVSAGTLIIVLGCLALAGGGFAWYRRGEGPRAGVATASEPGEKHSRGDGEGDEDAADPDHGIPVDVVHPKPGGIARTTTQAASVHAFEHAELFAKVSGYLNVQTVDIGDRVTLGQVLAVIEDPEIDKAVEQADAALSQANARVGVAREKVASAEADQAAARAMVRQEESEVGAKVSNQQLQVKQLQRIKGLVARNAVEARLEDEQQDRYEVATADVGVARATVLTAEAQVLAKGALVSKARADLAEAKADVGIAQANLDKAKVIQRYTRITSPYDGVVTLRTYHRGDFIRSASEGGTTPLLAISRTDMVRVVVPIPDVDVPYVNRGDPASFQVEALRGQTFTGVVSRYSESEDAASRNMRTEVDLPNADDRLREGMYGRMTIILQQAEANALTIPSSGLISQTSQGKATLFVVRAGKARKIEVQVTKDNGVEAEVLGGLKPDDQVITRYIGTIADGTSVIAETKAPAPPAAAAAH